MVRDGHGVSVFFSSGHHLPRLHWESRYDATTGITTWLSHQTALTPLPQGWGWKDPRASYGYSGEFEAATPFLAGFRVPIARLASCLINAMRVHVDYRVGLTGAGDILAAHCTPDIFIQTAITQPALA